ncbi:protein transporter Sec61 subunit gamma [Coniochaeta ligniaria NRRL 30616]|uniref:Protein transporter Sec61 subunit gamma n=1 Tax=Coniochaeta ligniaria NRRL 30616 TaxID=1408157 RepID=A0A1J7JNX9_9PEZI|nr:protein transporter Sec61 subunit gamma [Coniochaeta sp. PMI_546]OIW31044.1 protein transporter Sec61 subunit gamma [Coniochaeta ligniaria NRRL 30616]
MSDQVQEILDVPREFVKDGIQFLNRCQKPDKKEFLKISQAVGVGFLIMGAVGYVVKLVHIPLNGILVGGA